MSELSVEAARVIERLRVRSDDLSLSAFPERPGIYALWAKDEESANALDIGEVDREAPLYIGKAEDSLRKRLYGTHFRTGKTGWSTVRRTFAALLGLRACPRPSRISIPTSKQLQIICTNFGVVSEDEDFLTQWMSKNISVTAEPANWRPLKELETAVAAELRPPLNIEGVSWPTPCKHRLEQARRRMREAARGEISSP